MTFTRRDLMTASATALAASTLGVWPNLVSAKGGKARKRILVLGGTGFLGPVIVQYALSRGHHVSIFNRGKTRPDWFPTIDKRRGDRDPQKGNGLFALEKGEWDAVIDDSGYFPRHVKASAELLAPRVGQYIYISSISAYKDPHPVNGTEAAPLATMKDPTIEDMGKQFENYGALKALCEQAAQAALPNRTTIVRPGYIVGPDDPTGRFTYWPYRFTQPGEIAVPGAPTDPIQFIDVRDLGEWLVRLVETGTNGTYTACSKSHRWGDVVLSCQGAAQRYGSKRRKIKSKLVWMPWSALANIDAAAFPICAPPEGESVGVHTWNNAAAVSAGLRFRAIDTTIADTLKWYQKQLARAAVLAKSPTPPGGGEGAERSSSSAGAMPPPIDPPRTKLAFDLTQEQAVFAARNKAHAASVTPSTATGTGAGSATNSR